jgi:hypothetical protein
MWYYIVKAIKTGKVLCKTHKFKVYTSFVDTLNYPQGVKCEMAKA